MTASSTRPAYDDRVLSTLNADGSRRWLVPKPAPGRWLRARTWLGWTLIAVFVGLPLVPVGGRPAVLFDIGAREFTFFGAVLRPTEPVAPSTLTRRGARAPSVAWRTANEVRIWPVTIA